MRETRSSAFAHRVPVGAGPCPGGAGGGRRLLGVIVVSAAVLLAACGGEPSDEEATAVAALGADPAPSIEGASMFRASPSRDGVYHVDGPPDTPAQAWTFEAVADAYSSPAVSKDVVYFGGIDEDFGTGAHGKVGIKDVHLYAVDAESGQERWRFASEGSIFSSPAVADDVVYFGSADAGFYAVDAASGSQVWRFDAEGPIASSPVVVDDAVYFTDRDGYLYALNAATGQELWRFRVSEREFTAEGWDSWDAGTWSSPAVVDGTVYTGSSDGHVYAVDAVTGAERWRFQDQGRHLGRARGCQRHRLLRQLRHPPLRRRRRHGRRGLAIQDPVPHPLVAGRHRTNRRVRQQGRQPGRRRRGEGRRALGSTGRTSTGRAYGRRLRSSSARRTSRTSGSTTGRAPAAEVSYWPSISTRAGRSRGPGCPAPGSTRR